MNTTQVDTIFCDDVRSETGNKLSYMGVYGGNLLLGRFPAVLPRFCAVISLRLPVSRRATAVTFRLDRGDQSLGRATASVADAMRDADQPGAVDDEGRLLMRFVAQVAPLALDGPCRLQASVEIDGEVLNAGSLVVDVLTTGKP